MNRVLFILFILATLAIGNRASAIRNQEYRITVRYEQGYDKVYVGRHLKTTNGGCITFITNEGEKIRSCGFHKVEPIVP